MRYTNEKPPRMLSSLSLSRLSRLAPWLSLYAQTPQKYLITVESSLLYYIL